MNMNLEKEIKMENQVLSAEQMQELINMGIDISKASMRWMVSVSGIQFLVPNDENSTLSITLENEFLINQYIPTFTLQDILEMLPREIDEHHLILEDNYDEFDMYYFLSISGKPIHTIGDVTGKTPLEAAFNMLKWCKINNYI